MCKERVKGRGNRPGQVAECRALSQRRKAGCAAHTAGFAGLGHPRSHPRLAIITRGVKAPPDGAGETEGEVVEEGDRAWGCDVDTA